MLAIQKHVPLAPLIRRMRHCAHMANTKSAVGKLQVRHRSVVGGPQPWTIFSQVGGPGGDLTAHPGNFTHRTASDVDQMRAEVSQHAISLISTGTPTVK